MFLQDDHAILPGVSTDSLVLCSEVLTYLTQLADSQLFSFLSLYNKYMLWQYRMIRNIEYDIYVKQHNSYTCHSHLSIFLFFF